jgi:hypothetical protein
VPVPLKKLQFDENSGFDDFQTDFLIAMVCWKSNDISTFGPEEELLDNLILM